MKFVQILNNKAHWIFEVDKKPEFAPDIFLVDITGNNNIEEGWLYNKDTKTFTPPDPLPEPELKASAEEIAEETLLETKYQTFLLEMMM